MKQNILRFFLGCCLIFFSFSVWAEDHANIEILQTSQAWQAALSSKDPAKIANLYDSNAYLYATFENMIDNQKALLAYFTKLMSHENLAVKFTQQNIRFFNNVAINSGKYIFSYQDNGKMITVPARYTFVYVLENNQWKIIEHHSSVLPEEKNK